MEREPSTRSLPGLVESAWGSGFLPALLLDHPVTLAPCQVFVHLSCFSICETGSPYLSCPVPEKETQLFRLPQRGQGRWGLSRGTHMTTWEASPSACCVPGEASHRVSTVLQGLWVSYFQWGHWHQHQSRGQSSLFRTPGTLHFTTIKS